MSVTDIINLILSLCTVFIATFALWQTQKQIKISNKQRLFDRRLDKFMLIHDFIVLYKNCRETLSKETIAELVNISFNCLTNCTRLEEVYCIMEAPLSYNEKKIFLSKCEELEHDAVEIKFLWQNCYGDLASKFVLQYVGLLRAMHKQQISIKYIEKVNEKTPMLLEKVQANLNAEARSNGLFTAISNLKETYKQIEDCSLEIKLEESIGLIK